MNITEIRSLQDSDELRIRWLVSNTCNFKCQYCTTHDGDWKVKQPLWLVVQNFKHLINFYKEKAGKKKFIIELSGGEPTLWKLLDMFMIKMSSDDVKIRLVSNGSRTLRWWKQYAHLMDKVNFSFHHVDGNIENFIKVVDEVDRQGIPCNVNLMMDPKHWDKCIYALEYMKKHRKRKWIILAKPLFSIDGYDVEYTPEQKEFLKNPWKSWPGITWLFRNIKSRGRKESVVTIENKKRKVYPTFFTTNRIDNFQGWTCDLEFENLYIHWDGKIMGSCGQKLFNNNANIFDMDFTEKFNPILKSVVCSRSCCNCLPEQNVSKRLR